MVKVRAEVAWRTAQLVALSRHAPGHSLLRLPSVPCAVYLVIAAVSISSSAAWDHRHERARKRVLGRRAASSRSILALNPAHFPAIPFAFVSLVPQCHKCFRPFPNYTDKRYTATSNRSGIVFAATHTVVGGHTAGSAAGRKGQEREVERKRRSRSGWRYTCQTR